MVLLSFVRLSALVSVLLNLATSGHAQRITGTGDNLTIVPVDMPFDDYHDGSKYVPPPYLPTFSEHLNDIEIEYLEFIKQLRPAKDEAPVILSDCLTAAGRAKIVRRAANPLRKLP